jgi:hypothetical protein
LCENRIEVAELAGLRVRRAQILMAVLVRRNGVSTRRARGLRPFRRSGRRFILDFTGFVASFLSR